MNKTTTVLALGAMGGCRAVTYNVKWGQHVDRAIHGKVTGIVRDTLDTSDHDPVWAVAQLP